MKLIYTSLLILACSFSFAQQQRSDEDRKAEWERLKAARVAFLSNRLQLDVATAQKFWPIFNEYESKKEALGDKYNKQKRALVSENGWRNMSDENADKMLDIYLEQKQAELDLEKEYLAKFNKVLDKGQIWMVIRIDSDFRRSLMRRISDKDDRPKDDKGEGHRELPEERN
ncbi:hypothetical protein [Roseivirga sp.]|uniref:hypothetical protein n=1 Tax=Roseivirga sp. TaxID=1964215 RepID=UPI003B51F49A